jgi:glycosyltransferase involved in cell wall biosynthesis
MSISFVLLTLNEAKNLPACLDSLSGFDDIHLLDCGSTDGTLEIAKTRGIPTYHNPFTGFGAQRNWAIDNIPTKSDWHFHLDADERITPELAEEIRKIVASDSKMGGYQVPSKLLFAGRWLKRAGQYPGYQVRFFNKQRLRFIDYGHGQRETSEHPISFLKEPMLHYGFSKGIDAWFHKHITYARKEAEQTILQTSESGSLFSSDSVKRRRALKKLASKLPFRYPLRLLYMLIIKRGLLDGWAGMTYSHMLATYEGMIDVYLRLIREKIDIDQGL